MNCILFAKMDQVFSLKNRILKNTGKWQKILEKSEKSQGILLVQKSGNPALHGSFTLSGGELMRKRCL